MVFSDWYEPGYKAGGPIRSAVNFVNQMQENYDIFVFTGDRDLNENQPFQSVPADTWINSGPSAKIFYASPRNQNYGFLKEQVNKLKPDFIYLNSMFSLKFTLYPLWISRGRKDSKPILAPRGMLKKTALEFKPLKKKLFLTLFRISGMAGKIRFHATDPAEVSEIKENFGKKTDVVFIPNFSATVKDYPAPLSKTPGNLSIAFVGRVHPVKNLLYLLEVLKDLDAQISLDIIGDIEDEHYYQSCQEVCKSLKEGITVKFFGSRPTEEVEKLLLSSHIMVLPTVGENFGHSIFEAMALGKPVVISNNTPWKNLESSMAGFDIALSDKQKFTKSVQLFADMGNEEYQRWSFKSWKYVSGRHDNKQLKDKYIQLFS